MDFGTLVVSLLSGGVGAFITILYSNLDRKQKEKREIFKVLMANRYMIAQEKNIEALNMIDVYFSNSKDVRSTWEIFLKRTNEPNRTEEKIFTAYISLLYAIAEDLKYKGLSKEILETSYYSSEIVCLQQANNLLAAQTKNKQFVEELTK